MNKFVVYTAIVGDYDVIHQPQALDEKFDYVLFSNDIKEKLIGVWQVRNIPYENEDKTKIARWVKTHPEELLSEYEASVWMDGNIIIKTDFVYARIVDLFQQGVLVSSMWHNDRYCVYEEGEAVVSSHLERESVVIKWERKILKEKYPNNNGLWETNFLFRIHPDDKVRELDELWWNCIDKYSRRDQLSFPYSLWKKNLDCVFFLSDHENTRNSLDFGYCYHFNDKNKCVVDEKRVCYYYKKLHAAEAYKHLSDVYRTIARFPFPNVIARFVGQWYRLLNCLTR